MSLADNVSASTVAFAMNALHLLPAGTIWPSTAKNTSAKLVINTRRRSVARSRSARAAKKLEQKAEAGPDSVLEMTIIHCGIPGRPRTLHNLIKCLEKPASDHLSVQLSKRATGVHDRPKHCSPG